MLSPDDRHALDEALDLLERRSFVVSVAAAVGRPLEGAVLPLPRAVHRRIEAAARVSMRRALDVAIGTVGRDVEPAARRWLDLSLSTLSGGVGGAFGLAALPIELPISTTIMLRAVADIARSEGEDLDDPAVRVACLEVFALGSPGPDDDAAETGYWATRTALAQLTTEAATQFTRSAAGRGASSALVRFTNAVAARFGVSVGERVAVRAVPVVGALSGGALNYAFTEHLQRVARGHFVVRRLERRYGAEAVRAAARGEPRRVRVDPDPAGALEPPAARADD